MRALTLLEDRGPFKELSNQFLARRLIENTSISHVLELELINALAKKFNNELVSDVRKMMEDFEESRNLDFAFRAECSNFKTPPYFLVANSNAWPLKSVSDAIVPAEVRSAYDRFCDWYNRRYKGRKLRFLDHLSHVTLELDLPPRNYVLNVSGFQAIVLLEVVRKPFSSFSALLTTTGLEKHPLELTISSLMTIGLLVSSERACAKHVNNATYLFSLNHSFNSFDSHITLVQTFDSEPVSVPSAPNQENCDFDMAIQAAIVRIMKKEKTIDKDSLIYRILETLPQNKITRESILENIKGIVKKDIIQFLPPKSLYKYIE